MKKPVKKTTPTESMLCSLSFKAACMEYELNEIKKYVLYSLIFVCAIYLGTLVLLARTSNLKAVAV